MPAALRTLDVFVYLVESEPLAKHIRDHLARPMGFKRKRSDAMLVVQGAALPRNLKATKHFVTFHADRDERPKPRKIMSAHLHYRTRPDGPVPKHLESARARGLTAEWVEAFFFDLVQFDPRPLVAVEARVHMTKWDRKPTEPQKLEVDGAALSSCGAEYRYSSTEPGHLTQFRWREEEKPGTIEAWLSYDYWGRQRESGSSLWKEEQDRCLAYLRQLV